MGLPHEQTVNVLLSQLLQRYLGDSVHVIAEDKVQVNQKRGRFDIRIEKYGLDFVMEAAFDKPGAEKDAEKRLDDGLINTIAIAVYYDQDLFNNKNSDSEIIETLENYPLNLKIFIAGKDINETLLNYITSVKNLKAEELGGWFQVKLSDFNPFIDGLIELLVKQDILESLLLKIEKDTDTFIDAMNTFTKRNPKSTVMIQLDKLLFSPSENGEEQTTNSDVIYANTYISLLVAGTMYESLTATYGLDSLNLLLNKFKNPLIAFQTAFRELHKIDYEHIIYTALDISNILFGISGEKRVLDLLENLFRTIQSIVSNKVLLRQDFIGRLYHKVTGDVATRKSYATFYTKPTSAVLLTRLAFESGHKWNVDWGNLNEISNFKVCDFACGSGTLLSAAYSSLFSLYRKAILDSGKSDLDIPSFHKTMLENTLIGIDALEHAVQIASAVLALHEPGVPLDHMNTFHIPVGNGSLGSLNLYGKTYTLTTESIGLSKENLSRFYKEEWYSKDFSSDLIIMNPPFSRSTAPGKKGSKPSIFGFVTNNKEFQELWRRYVSLINAMVNSVLNKKEIKEIFNSLIKNGELSKKEASPINAGATFPFFFLADSWLKEHGKLALVLPKSVLSNSSFFLFRALIYHKYNIDYLITSTEPGNHNFSFSTNLSEILLILSKKSNMNVDSNMIIIRKQPKSILEAHILASSILSGIENKESFSAKGIDAEADISKVTNREIKENLLNWSLLVDLPVNIRKVISDIENGKILKNTVKLTSLKNLISILDAKDKTTAHVIGSRSFRGTDFDKNFRYSKNSNMSILTESGKDVMHTLKLRNGEFIKNIDAKTVKGKALYKNYSSHIVIPGTVRFNTYPLLANFSKEKLISSGSFMLELGDIDFDKAAVVWLNSIFMLLFIRSKFLMQEGNFGHIPGYLINSLQTPTDRKVIRNLSKIFDKYFNFEWKAIPIQLEEASSGKESLRLKFDLDIIKALNIKPDRHSISELNELYFSLSELLKT